MFAFLSLRGVRRLGGIVLLLLAASGCGGGLQPVRGKVVYEDGSPVPEGFVICETQLGDKPAMARSEIAADGGFRLGTHRPGDGAPVGKYRVLVTPPARSEEEERTLPPLIDRKSQNYTTSGLELDVKPGSNQVTFTVTKPRARVHQGAAGTGTHS